MSDARKLIERYNDAWNRQDIDAVCALHAPEIVFHNHTADERAEGADAVREHIGRIFANSSGRPTVKMYENRFWFGVSSFLSSQIASGASKIRPISPTSSSIIGRIIGGRIAIQSTSSQAHAK